MNMLRTGRNLKFQRNHGVKAITALSLVMLASGCVSYTNVPVPESAPAFESANHRQSILVITEALNEIIEKFPADEAYIVNLPSGTTPETFGKIFENLPGTPIMPTDELRESFDSMPTYHIGRVWIRASDAKVDVIYPYTQIDGTEQDQNVTVWISGGVRSWRTYRLQHWSPGTIQTPPIYVPIMGDEFDGVDTAEEPKAELEAETDIQPVDAETLDQEG